MRLKFVNIKYILQTYINIFYDKLEEQGNRIREIINFN